MSKQFRTTFFAACLLSGLFPSKTFSQWAPQADSIFGPYAGVQSLKAIDENTAWASVGTNFIAGVPTVRPWIIRTTDGGTLWAYDTIPGTAGYEGGSISALDADNCWVALDWMPDPAKRRLYHTSDGGQNWALLLEDRTAGSIVHFFDAQNGVVFNRNKYRYTTDGGQNWSAENNLALPDSTAYLPLSGSYATFGDTIWVTTVVQQLARSTDKGKSWELIDLPFLGADNFFAMITFFDGSHGMAASPYFSFPPKVWTTSDGGSTWTEVTPPQVVVDGLATLEAVEAIPGQLGWYLLQCSDFNVNTAQTYLTKDFGATWSLKDEQPAMVYAATAVDFVSEKNGWASLFSFSVEAACVFRWDGLLGLKADVPQEDVYKTAEGQPHFAPPALGFRKQKTVRAFRQNGHSH